MSDVPILTLNNGVKMPQLGLGVWQAEEGREVENAVSVALQTGYRLIDTAAMYRNEEGVGKAIRESGVPHEDIFVTTKLWNSDHGYDSTRKAFDTSLEKLGLDYVNLYLIHWPVPAQNRYVETWKALEEILKDGRALAIGVSNFMPEHLEELLAQGDIVPAVDQIELHPRLQQREIRNICREHGIQVESWSPIMRGGELLSNSSITGIAEKHGKTAAQVIIRWHIQHGFVVIPKSVHDERIRENFDVFDFELDNTDMGTIDAMDRGERTGPDPRTANFT